MGESKLVIRGTRPLALRTTPPPAGGGGATLDWFEDFRTSFTSKGLVEIADNATINRIPKGSATGTWPTQLTHVAENVYVAGMNAAYQAVNLWRNPAVGEYVFQRMLLNNSLPAPTGAGTGGDHGFQTNVSGPVSYGWRIWDQDLDGGPSATQFTLEALAWDESGVDEFHLAAPKDVVLRIEWRLQRTGTSSGVKTARCYNNQTGALLLEHGGMTQTAAAGGGANPYREYIYGMSGQGGADFNGGSVYWGALAARVSSDPDAWIGAYPVAGVED